MVDHHHPQRPRPWLPPPHHCNISHGHQHHPQWWRPAPLPAPTTTTTRQHHNCLLQQQVHTLVFVGGGCFDANTTKDSGHKGVSANFFFFPLLPWFGREWYDANHCDMVHHHYLCCQPPPSGIVAPPASKHLPWKWAVWAHFQGRRLFSSHHLPPPSKMSQMTHFWGWWLFSPTTDYHPWNRAQAACFQEWQLFSVSNNHLIFWMSWISLNNLYQGF